MKAEQHAPNPYYHSKHRRSGKPPLPALGSLILTEGGEMCGRAEWGSGGREAEAEV